MAGGKVGDGEADDQDRTPRLERVAAVLEMISQSESGLTLGELAARTDMPIPTVHRLVNSMLKAEFLDGKRGRSRYTFGSRLIRIFHNSLSVEELEWLVRPTLQKLSDRYGEVTYLVRLVDSKVRLAATRLPAFASRNLVYPGDDFPLHASASAKAMFAFQSENVVNAALDDPLEKFRPNTVTDKDKIRLQLQGIRELGYAINDDEYDAGVFALCCPVMIGVAGALYGVGIVAFKDRLLQVHDIEKLIIDVKQSAEVLAAMLQSIPARSKS